MIKIKNVSKSAYRYKYWVIRSCGINGDWFYGAWNDINKAKQVTKDIENAYLFINNK